MQKNSIMKTLSHSKKKLRNVPKDEMNFHVHGLEKLLSWKGTPY